MIIISYIARRLRERADRQEAQFQEELAAYRRCFEGTPEQQSIRLEARDWAYEATRPRRSCSSILFN